MENDWESAEIESIMRIALEQAELALCAGEVPVGCVFIQGTTKEMLAKGHNQTNLSMNATRHAELVAINDLLLKRKGSLNAFNGSYLFVTCEPCIMCAAAIAALGVKKVYFGCHNDRFGGNGSILSVQNGLVSGKRYEIQDGVLKAEAIGVFQRFYDSENKRAPDSKRRKKS
jgi:tRNA-specific adenosine deaminase 2